MLSFLLTMMFVSFFLHVSISVLKFSFGIESAKANVATIASMKEANATLKATMKNDLDIDAVEDLADDMAEVRFLL